MGVDISIYRCRVGRFTPHHGTGGICLPMNKSTEILGCESIIGILIILAGIERKPGPQDKYVFRYQYLLIEIGTKVMREIFDKQVHPDFVTYLTNNSTASQTLSSLMTGRNRKITADQEKLLPPKAKHPTSSMYDITLLTCLLRNICGLCPAGDQVWNNPLPTDHSTEADITRLKKCRNDVLTMGVDISTYRCRAGGFVLHPGTGVIRLPMNISQLTILIGAVSFVRLLLVIAGIERNPGPKDKYVFRYQYLLIEVGSEVLRKIFDIQVHPDFVTYLTNNSTASQTLSSLMTGTNRKITVDQAKLLPPQEKHPTSSMYDITLLTCLLRNICGLRPAGDPVWNKPLPTDHSTEADITRLKKCRNDIMHSNTLYITGKALNDKWQELVEILNRLNTFACIRNLSKLIIDAQYMEIDQELNQRYIETIKAWVTTDCSLNKIQEDVADVIRRQKDIQKNVAEEKRSQSVIQAELLESVAGVKRDMSVVQEDVAEVKRGQSDILEVVAELKRGQSDILEVVAEVKRGLSVIQADVSNGIRSQQSVIQENGAEVQRGRSAIQDVVADGKRVQTAIQDDVAEEIPDQSSIQGDVAEEIPEQSGIQVDVAKEERDQPNIQIDVAKEERDQPNIQIDVAKEERDQPNIQIDVAKEIPDQSSIQGDVAKEIPDQSSIQGDVAEEIPDQSSIQGDVAEEERDQPNIQGDVAEEIPDQPNIQGDVAEEIRDQPNIQDDVADVNCGQSNIQGDAAEVTLDQSGILQDVAEEERDQSAIQEDVDDVNCGQSNIQGVAAEVKLNQPYIQNGVAEMERGPAVIYSRLGAVEMPHSVLQHFNEFQGADKHYIQGFDCLLDIQKSVL